MLCVAVTEKGRPLVKVTQALTKSLGALGQSWDFKVMFYYNKIHIEIEGIYIYNIYKNKTIYNIFLYIIQNKTIFIYSYILF